MNKQTKFIFIIHLRNHTMKDKISNAFMTFQTEAPEHAKAWAQMVTGISDASTLDKKTSSLVYIGILAALGLESGIPFHVGMAKQAGASREEIIHAALMALPPAGHKVTQILPVIVESLEA